MFVLATLTSVLAAVSAVVAHPPAVVAAKRAGPTDVQILNYALTLEHLEAAFYKGGLEQFDDKDFADAGFPSWVRGRFNQISEHETEHVAFLSTALGSAATKACTYKFPYTDVKSFIGLSSVLENGGVSAYLGAASLISNKAYLTAAGAILTTEARHQAWVNSAAAKGSAWSGAFDVPLDLDQIYSIVAPFFVKCPSSNPVLPVKAFPTATYTLKGSKITLTYKGTGATNYLALYSGLTIKYVKINADKTATLPAGLQGTVFGVITTSSKAIDDSNTVAGPIILSFPFGASAKN